jgi:hypothetical protein
MRLRSNVPCRKRHVSPPKIRNGKGGCAMGGTTCCERRKDFEVLRDLSGSCSTLPLPVDLLRSQLHFAYKREQREHRHKLVVRP